MNKKKKEKRIVTLPIWVTCINIPVFYVRFNINCLNDTGIPSLKMKKIIFLFFKLYLPFLGNPRITLTAAVNRSSIPFIVLFPLKLDVIVIVSILIFSFVFVSNIYFVNHSTVTIPLIFVFQLKFLFFFFLVEEKKSWK